MEINRQYLSKFFENCTVIAFTTDTIIIVIVNWCLLLIKNKFIAILDIVKEVDVTLMDLGVPVNHAKHKKFIIIILIIMKAVNAFGAIVSFTGGQISGDLRESSLISIADFLTYEYFTTLCLQFIFFMWLVQVRYQHINDFLMHNELKKKSKEFQNRKC